MTPIRRGRCAQLTVAALEHGVRMLPLTPPRLARLLYRFNTVPMSARWRARFGAPNAVGEHLGTAEIGRAHLFGEQGWTALHAGESPDGPWLGWNRHALLASPRGSGVIYKLYVSPEVSAVRDAFQLTARCVLESDAVAIKVGTGVRGMLRPDKLVAYFVSQRELLDVASALRRRLSGIAAQGVPFTAPLTDDALLSCAVDPIPSRAGAVVRRESWRQRVTVRLAAALGAAAEHHDSPESIAHAALATLSRDGVDLLDTSGARALTRFASTL